MTYDGLGNRLQMTAYADGQSLTTRYELDNGRVLSANAAGNVTYYLYGLGPIGELTDAWNYSLPDGSNTPRQLVDVNGEVTFAAAYTPWGDTLETFGTGRFTQGYFGGIMDAATGLIYVGNGQYYDPTTGRFLTRDARPDQNNPNTPIDPTGALLGPLALLALVFGRKKSRGKWDTLIILLVLGASLGVGLAACGPTPVTVTDGTNTATITQVQTPTPSSTPTYIVAVTTPTATATFVLTPSETPEPDCVPSLTTGHHIPKTLPYGGEEVMALYNKMNEYKDGWWHKHPKYEFDFEVFIGFMIIHEGAGISVFQDLTVEILSQQLYIGGWNEAYCPCGPCSKNAIANNWAAYSESIHNLVDDYIRGGKGIDQYQGYGLRAMTDPGKQVETGKILGSKAIHPATLNPDRNNAISNYGNDPVWAHELETNGIKPYKHYRDGNPRSVYYFTPVSDGSAIYHSVNQSNCWLKGLSCENVPTPTQ